MENSQGGAQNAKLDYFVLCNPVRSCRNELHEIIGRLFQVNSIGIDFFISYQLLMVDKGN